MAEENSDDYGRANKEGRIRGMSESTLKKRTADEPVRTAKDEKKTSTQTPDPNVTSVGDTTDTTTSGTVTGDANVTRSANTSSSTTRGTSTGTSGTTSTSGT